MNVTNINLNSAVVNWSVSAGNFYSIDYRAVGTTGWINAGSGISAGTIALTNLSPATQYDVRVGANCSITPPNNYGTVQFSTTSHNSLISDLRNGYGIKISPNPVSDAAIIDYVLPGNGRVIIEVVNPQGQKILTLLDKALINGKYQMSVNNQLNTLAKGVYFIVLKQNNNSSFVKFVKY